MKSTEQEFTNELEPTTDTIEMTEIEKLEAKIAALEASLGAAEDTIEVLESQTKKRAPKGELCEFYNQKGKHIRGYGVRYYVVRMNGVLYYKQEDSVTLL